MIKKTLALASFIVIFTVSLFAQTTTATLSGSVTDDMGAVIIGATVTVLNTETGIRRTVVTNSDGVFTVPLLQPSRYQLTVQQTNYSIFEANDVVLNTNDVRFLNIRLSVGNVSEKVTVAASTVEVDQLPTVATVVDQNLVENIPLNGRTIQNLVALTPGAISFIASPQANVGQISVNGLRTTQNYMTIDGVSANLYVGTNNGLTSQTNGVVPGFSQLGTTTNLVSVDALQEFKVQSSSYSAEFGRSPGAQIQLTTRSGSNAFRGSIYDYFRNEKLDANDWFANANRFSRAPLRHNNFGGTFHGPLPFLRFGDGGEPLFRSGKDRTFFFFSYEGTRIRLPKVQNTTVPSRWIRNNANVALRPFFAAYPEPTGPDNTNNLTAPFVTTYSDPSEQDSYSIRIDHNINSKWNVFGRFSYSPQKSQTLIPAFSLSGTLTGDTRTFTVGANAAFSTNLTNELRFNWSRNYARNSSEFYSYGGSVDPATSLWRPGPFGDKSQFVYSFIGVTSFTRNPGNTGLRHQINITDSLTWVHGNHLFKVGGDYRQSPSRQESPDLQMSAVFLNQTAMVNGIANQVLVQRNEPRFTEYNWKNFGAFAQDTWRLNKRVTLELGLRWDVNPPADIVPQRQFVIADFVNPITLAPVGTPLFPTKWNGIAPRLGGAVQISDKSGWETVVRGGWGIFYDGASGAGSMSSPMFPFSASITHTNQAFPWGTTVLTPPAINTNPPYSGSFFAVFDEDFVLPRVYQYNVGVEQGLGANQTLSVTYVGNDGRRLLRSANFTPISRVYPIASPLFNSSTNLTVFTNAKERDDSSDYDAMQVQFSRRGKNVNALINYTWSHAFDTSSSTSNVISTNSWRVDPIFDRAESAFDRRHVFSAAFTWKLPFFSDETSSILNAITEGWSFDTIFQYQTAYPIDVTYQDSTTLNNTGSTQLRPDLVPGQPIWIDFDGPLGRRLNPAAFAVPTTVRQGNLPRNFIRVNALWQGDMALSRTFSIGEKVKLKLRGEVFNVANHPMFAAPSTSLGTKLANGTLTPSSTFGRFTNMLNRTPAGEGIGLNPIYAPGGPRSIQLSARVSF